MEEILKAVLKELQYQTKLLESIVEGREGNPPQANMEAAMKMVLDMPMFKHLGVDPAKVRSMVMQGQGKGGK